MITQQVVGFTLDWRECGASGESRASRSTRSHSSRRPLFKRLVPDLFTSTACLHASRTLSAHSATVKIPDRKVKPPKNTKDTQEKRNQTKTRPESVFENNGGTVTGERASTKDGSPRKVVLSSASSKPDESEKAPAAHRRVCHPHRTPEQCFHARETQRDAATVSLRTVLSKRWRWATPLAP